MNASVAKRMIVIAITAALSVIAPVIRASAQAPGEQPPVSPKPQQDDSGQIKAIDQQTRTLIIKGTVMEKTFDVAPDAVIVTKDKPKAGLRDLKVGDEVKVTYQTEGEKLIAKRIEVGEPKIGEIPGSPTPTVPNWSPVTIAAGHWL